MIENGSDPWSRAALYICTKCHGAISPENLSQPGNCGENLKTYLKTQLKEKGLHKEVRAMTSSCLGVCLAETQAMALFKKGSDPSVKILTCHPETDREGLLEGLINC